MPVKRTISSMYLLVVGQLPWFAEGSKTGLLRSSMQEGTEANKPGEKIIINPSLKNWSMA